MIKQEWIDEALADIKQLSSDEFYELINSCVSPYAKPQEPIFNYFYNESTKTESLSLKIAKPIHSKIIIDFSNNDTNMDLAA